jgi:polar amino acid transport system ATP-binding protein
MSPEVILFDEPTSALDPELVNEVLGVMKALAAEGYTMVVVTHEMDFARQVSDEVVFLGLLIEKAPPEKFFTNPDSERVASFCRAAANTRGPIACGRLPVALRLPGLRGCAVGESG